MASKREDIIEAATRLITQQGVHAASVAEIIATAHASAGSVYHHFAGKNAIVLAVAQKGVAQPFHQVLEEAGDATWSPADILRAIVSTVRSGVVDSALVIQLWAGSSLEPQLREILRVQFEDTRATMFGHIERWLTDRGVPDAAARVEPIARVTLGLAMGLLAQRTLEPGFDDETYVAEATRMLEEYGASLAAS